MVMMSLRHLLASKKLPVTNNASNENSLRAPCPRKADQHTYQNTREGRPKAPHSQDSCKRPHGQTVDKVAQHKIKNSKTKEMPGQEHPRQRGAPLPHEPQRD